MDKLENVGKYNFEIDTSQKSEYSDDSNIFLKKEAIDALVKARSYLPGNHNFIINDGYRTLEEQTKIVKIMEKELKKKHPNNWEELLNIYTGSYKELELQPKEISYMNHRSGYTLDLSISKNEEEINLGSIKFNEKDQLNYYESKDNLRDEEIIIKENRKLLKKVLSKTGFTPILAEWWHWGFNPHKKTY